MQKNIGFEVLDLLLASFVILAKLFNFYAFQFPICKMTIIEQYRDWKDMIRFYVHVILTYLDKYYIHSTAQPTFSLSYEFVQYQLTTKCE